jgi:putative transposase
MSTEPTTYPGYRFPAEVIHHAIWLYHLFSLSLRDIELILAERGVMVSYESIRRWCLRFGTEFAARLRKRRPRPGDTWHLDEVLILSAKSEVLESAEAWAVTVAAVERYGPAGAGVHLA